MTKKHLIFTALTCLTGFEAAGATHYEMTFVYNEAVPSFSASTLYTAGIQGSPLSVKQEHKTITPSVSLQQRLEQYTQKNVYISDKRFEAIYGAPPQAFKLANILSHDNPNVDYVLPTSVKSHSFSLLNNPGSYTGTNVTQWNRQRWDMGPSTGSTYGIDAPGAWNAMINHQLSDVYIAVIDNGVASDPPYDFNNRVDYTNSYHFYHQPANQDMAMNQQITNHQSTHGTHVGGTVIANGPNVTGVVGPVNQANAYILKAVGNGGTNQTANTAELWATNQTSNPTVQAENPSFANLIDNPHPAKVLNQSYGISRFDSNGSATMSLPAWVNNFFIPLCKKAAEINTLINQTDAVQVVAAGNHGASLINHTISGCPNINIIVVQATGPDGQITSYSSKHDSASKALYNQYATVLQQELGTVQPKSTIVNAPGGAFNSKISGISGTSGQIYNTANCPNADGSDSPTPNKNLDCYNYQLGTSMASPHVSGIVALIYMLAPEADYDYVSHILSQSTNTANVVDARITVQNVITDSLVEDNNDSSDNNDNPSNGSNETNTSDSSGSSSGLNAGATTAIAVGGGLLASLIGFTFLF